MSMAHVYNVTAIHVPVCVRARMRECLRPLNFAMRLITNLQNS